MLTLLIAGQACGPAADDPPPNPGPPIGPPRVRILVNERPQDPASQFVELDEARYGDPLSLAIDGIEPGNVVTVETTGGPGRSHARFAARADGTIDLASDTPYDDSGTWNVADGEAFLWSMVDPLPGAVNLTLTVRILDEDDEELATDTITRRYINDGLVVEPIDQGRSQGILALPQGDGPFPAVLVFGGSEGGTGTGEFSAMYLASLGYASMGVGYFGANGLPPVLQDVPVEIIEEDLALLTSDPRIDPERIVVMGGSRGGELALLVGSLFPSVVRGVIAQVPSGLVWGSTVALDESAWTHDGAPLPYVPNSGVFADVEVDDDGIEHWYSREAFFADVDAADPAELDAATIRAEDINGPVLFLSGADDQLWPSCELAEYAIQRRVAAGVADGDVVLCTPDAGHDSVGAPGWSTVNSFEFFLPDANIYLVLGGTPQGNARGLRDGDTATRAFLDRVFGL